MQERFVNRTADKGLQQLILIPIFHYFVLLSLMTDSNYTNFYSYAVLGAGLSQSSDNC